MATEAAQERSARVSAAARASAKQGTLLKSPIKKEEEKSSIFNIPDILDVWLGSAAAPSGPSELLGPSALQVLMGGGPRRPIAPPVASVIPAVSPTITPEVTPDISSALSAVLGFNPNFAMEKVPSDIVAPSQGMSLADIKSIAAQLSPNMEFAPLTTKDLLGVEDVGTLAGLTPEQVLAGAGRRMEQLSTKAALDKSALDLLRENTGARLAETMAVQAAEDKAAAERATAASQAATTEAIKERNLKRELESKKLKALFAGAKGGKGEKEIKPDIDLFEILEEQTKREEVAIRAGKPTMTKKEYNEKVKTKDAIWLAIQGQYVGGK